MCGPSTPRDNSASIARNQEAQRQNRIKQGTSAIDKSFSGFDEPFYQGYQDQYLDYYNPQLNDQYGDAAKKLTLQLAQTGNLRGSTGAEQLSDLEEFYNKQKTGVVGRATDATNQLRGDIDSRKSRLYADNRASADPGSATSAATSAASSLQPTAPSSPMANMFGDFFSNLGNVAAIKNARRINEGSGVQSYGNNGSSVSYGGE